jgi:hypothetical protein
MDKAKNKEAAQVDDAEYKDFLRSIFVSQKFNTGFADWTGIPAEEDVVSYGAPGYQGYKQRDEAREEMMNKRVRKAEKDQKKIWAQAYKQLKKLHPEIAINASKENYYWDPNKDLFGADVPYGVYGWGNDIIEAINESYLSNNKRRHIEDFEGGLGQYIPYDRENPYYSKSYTGTKDLNTFGYMPAYIRGSFNLQPLRNEYEYGNIPEDLYNKYISTLDDKTTTMPLETHNQIREIVRNFMPAIERRNALRREITVPNRIGYEVIRPQFTPPQYIDAAVAGYTPMNQLPQIQKSGNNQEYERASGHIKQLRRPAR